MSFLYQSETYKLNSKIAAHLAENAPAGRCILVDCFAGAGGNTIAFAKTGKWKRIYAIEKDPATLQCAKHNAKIYGVENQITWFEGDCFEILKKQLKDLAPYSVIFASPPWGGEFLQLFLLS
jgi:tRNA G37 N-methylase Trm5